MSEDVHYKLMCLLDGNPELSQRDVARQLGISLGKANYCLQELAKKGWVKISHFTNSRNKAAYMYLLTPRGLEEKASLTVRFLQAKMREYEALRTEIRRMRREARNYSAQSMQAAGISDSNEQTQIPRE
jgi:EPS-associated MarR family transcriptional regulator